MSPHNPWFSREGLALLTDFYQLTMVAGYLEEGRHDRNVCFEYFFRSLPPHAGFGVAAGLECFLNYLEHLHFDEEDLEYLRSLNVFGERFFEFLRVFRPACTVRAVPEGAVVFPFEPVVQVQGTIFEAQLIETALLNMLNYQTLIATKAARICLAAEQQPVLEFGLRRAHGPDGGLSGSRAAYIGGTSSTSNVLAGKAYGIPVSGTHAHSWVMSFPTELEAFRAFARNYPDRCVLLVDTYDTIGSGVPNAIQVFKEMQAEGKHVRPAIRLDSGDLAKLSKRAYQQLRDAGFEDPLIVASNDLNEDLIADLKRQGAKINAWGVGTHLITSYDCPALGGVYKLVAVQADSAWQPRIKITGNVFKATDPGRKRLLRYFDDQDQPVGDVMYLDTDEVPSNGTIHGRDRMQMHRPVRLEGAVHTEELLQPVFGHGRRVTPHKSVEDIRAYARTQIDALPEEFKRLRNPEIYNVILSENLAQIKEGLIQSY